MNAHEKIDAEIKALPAISPQATRVLERLQDPNASAVQIEGIVKYDPALTAMVLRLANSAYFAVPGSIGSVRQAIVRLGWKRVQQLVVASSVHGVLESPLRGYDLPPGDMWRHSLAVCVGVETLGEQLGRRLPEEAFTAALLHDVGKIALAGVVDEGLEDLYKLTAEGVAFVEAERQLFGIDHGEAGANVLLKWSLPETLANPVRYHHCPDALETPDVLTDVVHIADVTCLMMGIGIGSDGLLYPLSEGARKRLGLKVSDIERMASRTVQGVEELIEAIS